MSDTSETEMAPVGEVVPVIFKDPEIIEGPAVGPGARLPARAAGGGKDEGEEERERAFDATFHEWNGQKLRPFSIGRKSLFLQQRLTMGAPSILDAWRDFDAFLGDAVRILFLCSMPDEALAQLRGNPMVLQGAMDAWAEKNVTPKQESKATALGIDIYANSCVNEHEPAPSPHRDDEHSGN